MGLKKRLKKKVNRKLDFGKAALGQDTSKVKKYKDKAEELAAMIPEVDPQKDLENEMENYRTAEARSRTAAEEDAKRAGTYADTDAFRTSLTGEAGARARGLRSESLTRINALRRQLGMPDAPPGSI